jgi:hypothetical protein
MGEDCGPHRPAFGRSVGRARVVAAAISIAGLTAFMSLSAVSAFAVPLTAAQQSKASAALEASAKLPAAFMRNGVKVTVSGSTRSTVRGPGHPRAVLQERRAGGRWRSVARSNAHLAGSTLSYSLRWTGPHGGALVTLRVRLLAGRLVIGQSTPQTLRLQPAIRIHRRPRGTTVSDGAGAALSVTGSPSGTQTVVLGRGVRVPHVGGVLVLPASPRAPDGVLGRVTAEHPAGDGGTQITTEPATLDDAYSSFSAHVEGDLGELAPHEAAASRASYRAHASSGADLDFSCSDPSFSHTVTTKVDLSQLHLVAEVTKQPSIYLLITGSPKLQLGFSFSGTITCKAKASLPIPLADTGILVELGPDFTFTANGTVGANFTWTPRLTYGFLRSPSGNSDAHVFKSAGTVNFTGQASVKLSLALDAAITLAGRVGIEGSIGPEITGTVEAQTATNQDCLNVDADFHADLSAFADIFFKHWTFQLGDWTFGNSEIFRSCTAAPPPPPPPPPPPAPEPQAAVVFPGGPLTVAVGAQGQCQSADAETGNEYFPPDESLGDCGLFLAFPEGGTGQPGTLQFTTWGFDGFAGPQGLAQYLPVSQSGVTGSGSAGDPYAQTTVFSIVDFEGAEDARIIERTTYVNGESHFTSSYTVKNTSAGKLFFRAIYAGDLYVGGDDYGVGVLETGNPRFVGGEDPESGHIGGFQEAPAPSPGWSSFQEGCWNDVELEFDERCEGAEGLDTGIWRQVEDSVSETEAFDESIEPTLVDSGVGIEWDQRLSSGLAAGQEQTYTIINRG